MIFFLLFLILIFTPLFYFLSFYNKIKLFRWACIGILANGILFFLFIYNYLVVGSSTLNLGIFVFIFTFPINIAAFLGLFCKTLVQKIRRTS